MIDPAEIDRWWQLAMASTPGDLMPCHLVEEKAGKKVMSRDQVVAIFVRALAGADGEAFYGVLQRCADMGDLPGCDVPIAWMGCGANAFANADFFAEARTMVLKLIEENRALRKRLGED